ncbi:hypothetical protein [Acidisarcina polymorpha]|uniref:hypothetical protein n=1 Tax=Acidisarcina polymorpha TaxID=2211140 RepID=UPI00191C246E|nr:hypothetical protein [Acidisarcina polymorpha]
MPDKGRPGPVHVSLPSDLLDEIVDVASIVWPNGDSGSVTPDVAPNIADDVLAAIASASRPVIFAPPELSNVSGRTLLRRLEEVSKAPAVLLESPRGIADATLGAFPDLLKRFDLVVLLGKALDFTTHWVATPDFAQDVRVIAIDPEVTMLERAAKELGDRLLLGRVANTREAAATLIARAVCRRGDDWLEEVRAALSRRPAIGGVRFAHQQPVGFIRRSFYALCVLTSNGITTQSLSATGVK